MLTRFLRWFSAPPLPCDHAWGKWELNHAPYFYGVEVRKCSRCGERQEAYMAPEDIEPMEPMHEVHHPLPSRWRKAS